MSPNRPTSGPLQHFDFRCDHTIWQPALSMREFVRRDEVALHLIGRGRFRVVFASGESIELAAHRLMVSWGAIPHRAEFLHKNTHIYCLTIPLAWVLHWQLPPAFNNALLMGRAVVESDPELGQDDQHMLDRWVKLMAQAGDETRRIVLLEAEGRLRRLARTWRMESSPKMSAPVTKVEQVIHLIARRFADPLHVPSLAAEIGVHPDYLSTLFKRETGQTLSRYLTEYRLAHACALLVSTTDKIIDIAYAAGFGSMSQFHTSFRRYRGSSPRRYRLTHHAHTPAQSQ